MKLWGLKFSGMSLGAGIAIGAGSIVLGPIIIPALGSALKSFAKSLVKGGALLYEKGKVAVSEAKEAMEDLAAEARAEMAMAAQAAANAKALPEATEPVAKEKGSGRKKATSTESAATS